jgi:hypothetical protein
MAFNKNSKMINPQGYKESSYFRIAIQNDVFHEVPYPKSTSMNDNDLEEGIRPELELEDNRILPFNPYWQGKVDKYHLKKRQGLNN